jgi:protein-glucosylgalactosylhydroxylysine glucosidase
LMGLLLGFPALQVGPLDPSTWAKRDVMLPKGWNAIEVDHVWIRGEPFRLVTRQGKPASLTKT